MESCTQPVRVSVAPFVKSFDSSSLEWTTPFARSKSAPLPFALTTGTRSRTTMPASFTRRELKVNFEPRVTDHVPNTAKSRIGFGVRYTPYS